MQTQHNASLLTDIPGKIRHRNILRSDDTTSGSLYVTSVELTFLSRQSDLIAAISLRWWQKPRHDGGLCWNVWDGMIWQERVFADIAAVVYSLRAALLLPGEHAWMIGFPPADLTSVWINVEGTIYRAVVLTRPLKTGNV